jgi:hypothetical protein
MLTFLLALIAQPAVQVGAFVLGVIPSAASVINMFRKKKKPSTKPDYKTVKITCYGWADNDPPSADIALPVIHKKASGTGTYDDPITCAADPRQLEKGLILYVPRFQKYFIMEDTCGAAVKQDRLLPPIVDLWIGGTAHSDAKKLIAQEEKYTTDASETVIINPVNTLTVNATPLFRD